MPLTVVSLEAKGFEGLVSRQMAFNARGLSFVLARDPHSKRALIRALSVCFGAMPLSALPVNGTPPFVRVSMVGDSLVDLQVHSVAPNYQVVLQPGDQREVFEHADDMLDLLQKILRIPSLRVPLLPNLQLSPFVFPPELAPLRRADSKERSHRARRRREIERALTGARRRALKAVERDTSSQQHDGAELLEPGGRQLADLEAYEQAWEEHQRRLKAIEPLEADEARIGQLTTRLDHLRALLRDRFQTISSLPTAVLSDLPALVSRHAALKELREKVQAQSILLTEASAAVEALVAELEPLEARYGQLPNDFPLHLQRWQVLADSLKAAEAEAGTLGRQLQENQDECEKYHRFDDRAADYQARLGALVVQEEEDAVRLKQVEANLNLVQSLLAAQDDVKAEVRSEFDGALPTLPEELRELEGIRARLKELHENLDPLDEKIRTAQQERPVYLEWADKWPADFPSRLRQWRAEQHQVQRRRLERQTGRAERREGQSLVVALEQLLQSCEGLHEQAEGFPERLEEWLRMRQELLVEMEAYQGLQERIKSLEVKVDSGRKRYGAIGDQFVERVGALRSRVADLRQKQARLQQLRGERAELELQWVEVAEKVNTLYEDLQEAPADLPARLQEYHRLRRVEDELKRQEALLRGNQEELEEKLAERYSSLEQVTSEIRVMVEAGRSHDATLHQMLVRLERDVERRRQAEERLAAPSTAEAADIHRLEGQLEVLPPVEETEALRTAILALVAGRLEGTGLSVGAADYLEYQSIKAEIHRVSEHRERLLQRSGSGNDLSRIGAKLAELTELLGERIVAAPLEETLARYEAFSVLRDTMQRFSGELQALAGEAALAADCRTSRKAIEKEKKRLQLVDEADLDLATARYQEYRAAQNALRELQELVHQRWSADGGQGLNLDKLQQQVASLEKGLGRWAVQSLDQVAELKARWRLARQVFSELQGERERLARLGPVEADAEASGPLSSDLDVPDSDAHDELISKIWQAHGEWQDALRQLNQARGDLLDAAVQEGETTATVVDALHAREHGLETSTGAFARVADVEAVIALFEVDQSNRSDISELERKLEGLPTEPELVATALELHERRAARRGALGLDADEKVEHVLELYARYQHLQEERRTLRRLLASREPAIQELRTRMEELIPLLGDRHLQADLAHELLAYQGFKESRLRRQQVQVRLQEVRHEADKLAAARRKLEAEMHAVEIQIPGGRSLDDLLSDYPEYTEIQRELEELRRKLSAQPSLAVLRRQLIELQTEVEAIIPPPPDFSERLGDMRTPLEESGEPRRVRALERGSELLEELSHEQWTRATVEQDGTVWLWSPGDGRSPVAEGPAWLATLWQLALIDELGAQYPWPLIFDEPFADLDTRGAGLMRERLRELGKQRQVIVLTGQEVGPGADQFVADLSVV